MKMTVENVEGFGEDMNVKQERFKPVDKFLECIKHVEENDETVQKVVMHYKVWQLLLQNFQFYSTKEYGVDGTTQFYGVKIEVEDLGVNSITDYLVYTDRRVVHSDMLEKNFIEELDIEQALEKVNEKIDADSSKTF